MAIAFVQSAYSDTVSPSPTTVAFGSANTAGNTIIVAVMRGSATDVPTVSDSKGNIYTEDRRQAQTTDGTRSFVFSAPNIAAGANTVSVAYVGAGSCRAAIHEYSGLATSGILDQVNSAQADATTAPDSGNVTTLQADELLFGFFTGSSDTGVITPGTNYILRETIVSGGLKRAATEDRIVSSTLTTSANFTHLISVNDNCIIVTYKAPAAGPTTAQILPSVAELLASGGMVGRITK